MNTFEQAHVYAELLKGLRYVDQKYPLLPGLVYRSHYGFVAEHGRVYEHKPWSRRYEQGLAKHCYHNAIIMAVRHGLKYIEGVAVSPQDGAILFHGWNADANNEVIDVTWCNTAVLYFGVEFSVERADDATWNGDSHILNDEKRNYPIFQKRWTGEDYTLEWPYSDRLDYIRNPTREIPPSVAEHLRSIGDANADPVS